MTRWEYKIERLKQEGRYDRLDQEVTDEAVTWLNLIGDEGWELVKFEPTGLGETLYLWCLFKRGRPA